MSQLVVSIAASTDDVDITDNGAVGNGPTITARKASFESLITLLRFDTSALPDDALISSAVLNIYVNLKYDDDNRSLVAEWYAWTPPAAAGDFAADVGTNAIAGEDITGLTAAAVNNHTLANANVNISRTGYTGLRLGISGATPVGDNLLQWASFDDTSIVEPKLTIDYTLEKQTSYYSRRRIASRR